MGHHGGYNGRYTLMVADQGKMDQNSTSLRFYIKEEMMLLIQPPAYGMMEFQAPTSGSRSGSNQMTSFHEPYTLGAWKSEDKISQFSNCQIGEIMLSKENYPK